MAVETTMTYTGDLHCEAVHGPSASKLITDAPVDNGGRGAAFSPTDLIGVALGTCVLTLMGKAAALHNWDVRGATVRVSKEMAAKPSRRIGTLRVTVTLPPTRDWLPEDRQRLETAALTCPVHETLRGNVEMPIEFVYPS